MNNLRDLLIVCLVAVVATLNANPTEKQLSAGNAKFTSSFFNQIRGQKGNLLFSPVSMEIILAMAHAGAGGKTAAQIQQTVHLPETPEKSALLYGQLRNTFKNDDMVTLNLANAIFADKKFKIKQDYSDVIQNGFQAKIGQVDFGKREEAAKTINDFVAENTGNKIKKLVKSSKSNKLVFVCRCWEEKFPATRKCTFHLSERKDKKKVNFMKIRSFFPFARNEDLDAKIIEIPYKGNTVSMVLVVPNTVNGLSKLEAKIATTDLNELTNLQQTSEVILTMPKFKIDTKLQLRDLLIKMGVTDLFDESKANLTRMADTPVVASSAVQKTYIEVTEFGTEAAAATEMDMMLLSSMESFLPPEVLTVDRPFLFFLNHKPTGLRLFMGRVASP